MNTDEHRWGRNRIPRGSGTDPRKPGTAASGGNRMRTRSLSVAVPWASVFICGFFPSGCEDDTAASDADVADDAVVDTGGEDGSGTDGDADDGAEAEAEASAEAEAEAEAEADGDVVEDWGTTWYVRPGGGDGTQCTGLVDADYAGSGTDQPCAFRHPFVALPPGGAPVVSGGDRVIIAEGSYAMGFGAAAGDEGCDSSYTWECLMPPIPSGPDAEHPTRIYGAGWDTGCTGAKPELYGVERPWAIVDLAGASHVRIECLELTDHSDCVESHSGGLACVRDTYPHGEWAAGGIRATDSADVLLRHLDIHGLASFGIHAGRLTDWTLEDVRIAANGWVGFDGDVDGDDGNSGTTTFRRVTVEWNGCGETFPGGAPTGCWGQSAGGYGDGLGTGETGGDWVFEDSRFLHNTSDGLDLLYHRRGGTVRIARTRGEGNAGNQLKAAGEVHVVNSVAVGNCGYFDGKSFTHDVDNCRAVGNAVAFAPNAADAISMVNTTVYGEGDCLMEISECTAGTTTFTARNNVFLGDVDFLQPFEHACFYWEDCPGLDFDADWNLVFGTKDDHPCPIGGTSLHHPQLGPTTGDEYGMVRRRRARRSTAASGGQRRAGRGLSVAPWRGGGATGRTSSVGRKGGLGGLGGGVVGRYAACLQCKGVPTRFVSRRSGREEAQWAQGRETVDVIGTWARGAERRRRRRSRQHGCRSSTCRGADACGGGIWAWLPWRGEAAPARHFVAGREGVAGLP